MESEHEEGELHLQPTVYFSGQFRDVKKITYGKQQTTSVIVQSNLS